MAVSQTDSRERQFYTVPEAAEMLRVSPATVWRWIAAQRLPAQRVGPRNIRILKDDLEAMISPARAGNVTPIDKEKRPTQVASREELARRQSLVARIIDRRRERLISPMTTADLVNQVREERTAAGS